MGNLYSQHSLFASWTAQRDLTESLLCNTAFVPALIQMSPFCLSGSCSKFLFLLRRNELTYADLLGVKGLAAVVGRPREVRWWGVDDAGSGPPQDEVELTQHTWDRGGRDRERGWRVLRCGREYQCNTFFSEREQCELAEKRIWGWKEREQVMRVQKQHRRRINTSRGYR